MVALTYPGVYVQEIPSGVRAITGVATSITAFVGRARRGAVNKPIRIANFGDFAREFGGLWSESTMSYAVRHFFLNGGTDAIIVRVENAAVASTATINGELDFTANSPGLWGNQLRLEVDLETRDPDTLFNLIVYEVDEENEQTRAEIHRNLSVDPNSSRFVVAVVNDESTLVTVAAPDPDTVQFPGKIDDPVSFTEGTDGGAISDVQVTAQDGGINALKTVDIFNILCIPPYERAPAEPNMAPAYAAAIEFFGIEKRRAILLQDPPQGWDSVEDAVKGLSSLPRDKNAALFFPNIVAPDPEREGRLSEFAPCGAMAGVLARTDATRGVWKAPAGIDATVRGASALALSLTDNDNGRLNPLGVNCLRSFPVIGKVVWGARTRDGADLLASEWKYLPVRRLALFLEESLFRGTQWVVFEPNDEALWGQIRLNVGAFMQNLFRQGAFQGTSPADAYFVKCDKETTTQNDIDLGIVNIVIGFAPLKPAEFVVLKFQQIAGQVAA